MLTKRVTLIHTSFTSPAVDDVAAVGVASEVIGQDSDFPRDEDILIDEIDTDPDHPETLREEVMELRAKLTAMTDLRDRLDMQNSWLKAALNCTAWVWDSDQRVAAEDSLESGEAAVKAWDVYPRTPHIPAAPLAVISITVEEGCVQQVYSTIPLLTVFFDFDTEGSLPEETHVLSFGDKKVRAFVTVGEAEHDPQTARNNFVKGHDAVVVREVDARRQREKDGVFTKKEATLAIAAREEGEFDHPLLRRLGPLSQLEIDIERIRQATEK